MVEDIYKEIADLQTEEDRIAWESRLKQAVKEMEAEHKKGSPAAVFEMLSICLHDDREWYGNGAETECGWDYTRIPTWAVEGALEILGDYLKKWQSDGRGRNAKWLTRFEQQNDDFYMWFNVNAATKYFDISIEEACERMSEELEIPAETLRAAYKRYKARIKEGREELGYQYVHFLK